MALTDPQDTLAYHMSRPLTAKRDLRNTPMNMVTEQLAAYHAADQHEGTVPEDEAIWFYGMNHGMALIASRYTQHQPMTANHISFVSTYYKMMNEKAMRAFYYLLVICTREARHNQSLAANSPTMVKLFGQEAASFFVGKGGEDGIHQALMKYPPMTTLGKFVECIRWQFYNSSWSGGFGGKKWGQVTDCLARFVSGEFTAEMMLDTVWTLSHNNGPIFNKGHFYGMYSHCLVQILDIQRSGQVLEMILDDGNRLISNQFINDDLKLLAQTVRTMFPEDIGTHIDWYKVEALGSLSKYPTQKSNQTKLYGLSAFASEQDKKVAAKEIAENAKIAKLKNTYADPYFEITAGVKVLKMVPDRDAA